MNNNSINNFFDSLTGLYREELFAGRISEEINRSNRHKLPFSLLLIEIDEYDEYAERYDETETQKMLVSVCRAVKHATREIDYCFLFPNGRIYIILPYTDSFGAALVGEKIRKQVMKIQWLKEAVTVTGAIVTYLRETRKLAQMMQLLEKRIQLARNTGGNQIYSDTTEISLVNRLDFYFRKKYTLLKYHKKQLLFDIIVLALIILVASYYIHSIYQERERWELQYRENFSSENMDIFWEATSGRWVMEDGKIRTVPGKTLSYVLTHRLSYTGNYKIIMEGYFEEGVNISDLSLILGGMTENPQKGYFVGIGSNENSRHKLLKSGEEILVNIGNPLKAGTRYNIVVEKVDQHIHVSLNGENILSYWDLFPLSDIRHNKVSIYTFFPGVVITNFEIHSRKEPRMVPLFNIPDTLFRLGLYEEAYYEYRDLSYEYADTDIYDILVFKKALCLMKVHRLEEAQVLLERVIYSGNKEELIPYAKQQLVQIQVEKGQFGLALSALQDLIREYRDNDHIRSLYSSYLMSLGESLAPSHPLASNDFFHSYKQRMRYDSYGCAYASVQKMENFLKVEDVQRFQQTKMQFNEQFAHFRDFAFQRDRLSSLASFIQGDYSEAFNQIELMFDQYQDLDYNYPQLYAQQAQYYFYRENYEELETLKDHVQDHYNELESHDIILVHSLWAFSKVLRGETRQGIDILDSLTHNIPSQSVFQTYPQMYLGYSYYLIGDFYLAREAFVRASESALKRTDILRNANIMVSLTFLAERNPFAAKAWLEDVIIHRPLYSLDHLCARYLMERMSSTEFLQKFASEKKRLLPLAYFITAEKALFHNNDSLAREYYRDSLNYTSWNEFPAFLVESRIDYLR